MTVSSTASENSAIIRDHLLSRTKQQLLGGAEKLMCQRTQPVGAFGDDPVAVPSRKSTSRVTFG